MTVIQGGTYGPGDSFPDDTIFIGCTLKSACTFGKGCIFYNCNIVKSKKAKHSIGDGAIVSGGYVEWANFGVGAILGGVAIGGKVTFNGEHKIDTPGVHVGEATTYSGCGPVQGSTEFVVDWCETWRCRVPYIDASIVGRNTDDVTVTYCSTEYTLPPTA